MFSQTQKNHFDGICNIFGQIVYELQETFREHVAVLTDIGWSFCGPMTGKRKHSFFHVAFREDVKVLENILALWYIKTYASKVILKQLKVEELQGKMLVDTAKFLGEWNGQGMLRSEPEQNPIKQLQLSLISASVVGAKGDES